MKQHQTGSKQEFGSKRELAKTGSGSRHRKISKIKYLFLLLLAILFYFLVSEQSLLADPEVIKSFILNFGAWAPLILILLQALQSMISIIPSQVTTIAAGFLFGPVLGFLYALIGATLGSAAIFLISRKYGKKLALNIFNPREIVHFEAFFKQKKSSALFLARVAPLFPNDVVSFVSGLTDISLGRFTLISTLGFILQIFILVLFGSQLAEGEVSIQLMAISIIIGLLFLVLLFKGQIKKILIKDLHKVEKGLNRGMKIVF